jgi:AcrR family transcriptional regulator
MAEKLTSTAKPSRRQEHKMRTKRALQQAALDLFAKDGYDTTTTDEIAERAGVSARTFFRYFPTKDSVLFVGEYGWLQSLTEDYVKQPDSLADVDALLETLLANPPGRRSLLLYEKAVTSSPTLRGVVFDHQQEDIETLAEAIATRRGLRNADEGCRLLATVVLITYRRALTRWIAGPASVDARNVIAEEFKVLQEQFTPANAKARRRTSR